MSAEIRVVQYGWPPRVRVTLLGDRPAGSAESRSEELDDRPSNGDDPVAEGERRAAELVRERGGRLGLFRPVGPLCSVAVAFDVAPRATGGTP